MLLGEALGNKYMRSVINFFAVEALGEDVFELVRICERGIRVEADEVRKIVDARHIAIRDVRLDSVLIPFPGLVFFARRPVKEAFQGWGAKLDCEFTGVAGDGRLAKQASGIR